MSINEVKAAIEKKNYPEGLLEGLRSLADRVVDTHERFHSVKPPDPHVMEQFAADLAKVGADQYEPTTT